MVRQIDIARETGYSLGVVSRTLNNRRSKNDRISEETRSIIHQTAERMGYRANVLASSLRKGKTPAVRILLPAWTSNPIVQLTMGISDAARRHDYPLTFHYYSDPNDCREFLESMNQQKNTGVLLYLHPSMKRRELVHGINTYRKNGGKLVLANTRNMGFEDFGEDILTANIDDEYGGRLAAEYLIEHCRCRGFSIFHSEKIHCQRRYAGFVEALEKYGFELDYGFQFNRDTADCRQLRNRFSRGFEELQRRMKHFPHGVFLTIPLLGALFSAKPAGDAVFPVCFDVPHDKEFPFFNMGSIDQPFYQLGNQSFERLVDLFSERPASSLLLKPELNILTGEE